MPLPRHYYFLCSFPLLFHPNVTPHDKEIGVVVLWFYFSSGRATIVTRDTSVASSAILSRINRPPCFTVIPQFLQYWYEMIVWHEKKRGQEVHLWDANDFSY